MKKPAAIVAFIIVNLCFINTWAQVKLTSARIKEILVHNIAAGLGGGTVADIKVVPEGGQWHSYLITKTTYRFSMERKTFDSTIPKLIATVDPLLISGMLNGLAVIKPAISPTTFSLRASQLIADIKSKAKAPVIKAPDFEKLVTQKDIDDAVAKTVVNMNVMDDFEFCEIGIVTDRNDTVKLSTRNVCATKLPWTLNNLLTYDMAFNYFVLAAIGAEDVPNKKPLNINSLKESIYNYIDAKNQGAPIATFKWDYGYPENLKLLTDHFIISKSFRTGDEYSCTMRTKDMPTNALIYGWINMASTQDIKTVIAYAALIEKYVKADNFMLKYYSNRPKAFMSFGYYSGLSPYHSVSFLKQKLPELAKIDSAQTISFYAGEPDDSSSWIVFPDNKALLTYHSITTPHGETAPIYPPHDPKDTWSIVSSTYYLFDKNGKVLSQGMGFK